MAMVLLTVVAAIFSVYIGESFNAWRFFGQQKKFDLSINSAVIRMTREIREIKNPNSISVFSSNQLVFVDVDNNTVSLSQSATSLLRNGDILLEDLSNPGGLVFTYLNNQGTTASSASSIRSIRFRLTLQKNDNKFVVESAAAVRNTD